MTEHIIFIGLEGARLGKAQTGHFKVKRLRPDQLPGPVTTLPGAASTREDEDANLSATHGSVDPSKD